MGEQLCGEGGDLELELVLGEGVQRQVGQAGVLQGPNPVLGPGPEPVADLEVGEPPALGVRREQRDPSARVVGDPRAGVGPLPAGDDPDPGRPAGEARGQPPGRLDDLRPVWWAPSGLNRRPAD